MSKTKAPAEIATFTVDKSGVEYAHLDKTHSATHGGLYPLLAELRAHDVKAVERHLQAAAQADFARVWNKRVRSYTSKRNPLKGVRMKKLVADCADDLKRDRAAE